MKKIKISILIITFIFTSCNSSSQNTDIILNGKIGEFDAEMILKKEGDFFNGLFTYATVNDKKIKLKGQIESNKLRLSEFNNENEITGLFVGSYLNDAYQGEWSDVSGNAKVPFLFRKNTTFENSNKNKKQGVTELKSKKLLETYFKPFEYVTDSLARYKTGNNLFDIEFYKNEDYNSNGKHYSIAIFGHHPLDSDLERGYTTAQIGESKFSALTFEKNNGVWIFINQIDDLNIGTNIRGEVYLPKIKQIENFTFLELPDVEMYASGSLEKTTTFFNVINFNKALEIRSGGYQAGGQNVDEFIKEMNNDKYNSNGEIIGSEDSLSMRMWSTSNSKYKFTIQNKRLLCIVDYTSGYFDEKKEKFIKEETTTIYTYDEDLLEFKEIK